MFSISAPEEEWKNLWKNPDFVQFLNHCVEIEECMLNLNNFLREHESLKSLLPPDILQKIIAAGSESKQTVKQADRFWENGEIPERFQQNKEMFEFIHKGQRIEEIKRAYDAAFRSHALEVKGKGSIEVMEMCMVGELQKVPCGSCQDCNHIAHLQRPLQQRTTDWQLTKQSIDNYRQQVLQTTVRKAIRSQITAAEQQSCRMEFDRIVSQGLSRELASFPARKWTPKQKAKVQEDIFHELKDHAAAKDRKFCLEEMFSKDLRHAYHDMPQVSELCMQLTLPVREILGEEMDSSLKPEIRPFEAVLKEQPRKLLELRKSECYDDQLVGELKQTVSNVIEEFCTKTHDLSIHAKACVHAKAQQVLREQLAEVQEECDKKNSSSAMLDDNKEHYMQVVDIVLTHGLSFDSEVQLLANSMLRVIRESAAEMAVRERVGSVLALPWMRNSQSIRTKYFREISLEVKNGNKKRALSHFSEPQTEIEKWFANEIDNCNEILSSDEIFGEQFESQFEVHCRQIREATRIHDILNLSQCDQMLSDLFMASDFEDVDKLSPTDFYAFKNTICTLMARERKHYQIFESKSHPSKNLEIMSRLGCTETCFWCGALCWGERGHNGHIDETRIHFSSHQPSGLHRINVVTSGNLVAQSCHLRKDDNPMTFRGFHSVPWAVAKSDHFSDWNFERHYDDKLDELMRWFMQELHVDIARNYRSLLPATVEELQRYGCVDLELDEILQRIDN